MSTADLSAEHPTTATLLLDEWEHKQPAGASRIDAAVRDAFTALVADALASDADVNVDQADIRHVLDGATGLGVGRGGGSGPQRAQQALADAWQQWQAVDWYLAGQGNLLIVVQSREDRDLEIPDLTVITEALQQVVGLGWACVFGHGVGPGQAEELRLGFLLAPLVQPEEMSQHRALRAG